MMFLFMIALHSFEDKSEQAQLYELTQKAYLGIETLANGFKNNFRNLLQNSPTNKNLNGLLDKQFAAAVDACVKSKHRIFKHLMELDYTSLEKYALTGSALQLKLQLLNIHLMRLDQEYCDYSRLYVSKDLSSALSDLLLILEKLSYIVDDIIPLIDMLQLTQSLLQEIVMLAV